MSNSNDVMGSITVTTHNKMRGTVRIIGYGENDLSSNIITKYNNSIESALTVYSDNVIDENGRYGNQIKSSVEIPHSFDLYSSISIMPHNQMKIIAEIIEPPKTKAQIKKIQDSLIIKSSPTLNFGNSSNTFIGKNYEDEFRTLIKVDIDDIPKENQVITKSELVIQKENYTNSIGKIELFEVLEPWSELGVTWKNQPRFGEVVAKALLPLDPGEVKINILSKVNEWYKDLSKNYGFMIKVSTASASDITTFASTMSTSGDIYQFGTSKSVINSPFADIEYYDESLTYSSDIYKLPSAVTIRQNKFSELPSSLFINSYWGKNELVGSITVPKYDEVEDLISNINVRKSRQENLLSSVFVSNPQLTSSINVFSTKSILTRISVRNDKDANLNSAISVRGLRNSELRGRLTIKSKNAMEELNSSITISKPDLLSTVKVKNHEDLLSNISVRRRKNEEIASSLFVSRPELVGSLKVNKYGDITSSISIRQVLANRLASNLFVSKPDLISNLTVHPTSSLPSSLTVISDYLDSSLIVRRSNDDDLESNVVIRVLKVNELLSLLRVVKSSDLTGNITIRSTEGPSSSLPSSLTVINDYLDSSLAVRRIDDDDLQSNVKVALIDELISSLMVFNNSNLDSNIIVTPTSSLPSSLTVINDYIDSSLIVRVSEESELESGITIRKFTVNELETTLSVTIGSDLTGSITVVIRENGEAYAFIM